MRTLIYAAALSLMAHAAIAQPCRQIFTLWNDTSVSIVAIYASGSDRKLFGPNMMPKGRVLAPGYRTRPSIRTMGQRVGTTTGSTSLSIWRDVTCPDARVVFSEDCGIRYPDPSDSWFIMCRPSPLFPMGDLNQLSRFHRQ